MDNNNASLDPAHTEPLADGTNLVYNRERTGEVIPNLGLILEPGYYVTVGKDLSGSDAAALVNMGTLRVYAPDAPEPEQEIEDKPESKPEDKTQGASPPAPASATTAGGSQNQGDDSAMNAAVLHPSGSALPDFSDQHEPEKQE